MPRAHGSGNTAPNPWCRFSPTLRTLPHCACAGQPRFSGEGKSQYRTSRSEAQQCGHCSQALILRYCNSSSWLCSWSGGWWPQPSFLPHPTEGLAHVRRPPKAKILKTLVSMCVLFECVVWKSSQATQILTPPLICPAGRVFLISHPPREPLA